MKLAVDLDLALALEAEEDLDLAVVAVLLDRSSRAGMTWVPIAISPGPP